MPGPGPNPTTSSEFADTFKQMNEAESVVAKLEKILDDLDVKIDSILTEVSTLDSNYLNSLDQKVDQQISMNYSNSLQQQILNPNQNISASNNMNKISNTNIINRTDSNNTNSSKHSQSLNNILDSSPN